MVRYIDAEKFLSMFYGVSLTEQLPIGSMKILLSTVPTEDVAPVTHAHWEDCSNGWMCSNCCRDRTYETDYCPNCGAKMDEE